METNKDLVYYWSRTIILVDWCHIMRSPCHPMSCCVCVTDKICIWICKLKIMRSVPTSEFTWICYVWRVPLNVNINHRVTQSLAHSSFLQLYEHQLSTCFFFNNGVLRSERPYRPLWLSAILALLFYLKLLYLLVPGLIHFQMIAPAVPTGTFSSLEIHL